MICCRIIQRGLLLILPLFVSTIAWSQELYVFSEPASNMPTNSISAKISGMFANDNHSSRTLQRYMPEVMLGINKNWMIHGSVTFSDMHQSKFVFESSKVYAKWRFLSRDDVHKHFRMAAFGAVSYSRNRPNFSEINLNGDHSGVQIGLIATQLWNRLAVSGSASLNEVLHKYRWDDTHEDLYPFQALKYSLSAGYLVLPLEYRSYDQTNLNFYVELLGGRNLDWKSETYYIDLAPAIQLIFKSTDKLNFGYRYQVAGDVSRMANKSFLVSYEHVFLNAIKKKK